MNTGDLIKELMQEIKLSYKQALFCIHYAGNATTAGKQAGYKNPDQCSRLLQKNTIQQGISLVNARKNTHAILTRQEILELYTSIARNTNATASERLRALDSLARTHGMFIDKQAIMGQFSIEHLDKYTDTELIHKVNELISFLNTAGIPVKLPGSIPGNQAAEDRGEN